MNTELGAKFNTVTTQFSSRDSLGIESVAASISGELCPIVNTVTPRAFYWVFLCWIYYDFYKNSGIKEKDWNRKTFDEKYLKRQDYFFVLANLLAENPDQTNLVGIQKTRIDKEINKEGPYSFNPKYFLTAYGGMQYYNAGCLTMGLITNYDDQTGRTFKLPRLTQYGEKVALAFEKAIQDTEYYKQYRLKDSLVPRHVLIQYGKVLQLNMANLAECRELLRHFLFERNKRLTLCAEYARQLHKITGTYQLDSGTARKLLYDYYSPRGDAHECIEELRGVIQGWEIVIGRQYFTAGIEMIWKYMLFSLKGPCSFEEWTGEVLNSIEEGILDRSLDSLIPECIFSFEERERMVSAARTTSINSGVVVDGLKLAISVYNRFNRRTDLEIGAGFLDYGKGRIPGTGGISINEWIESVNRRRNETVRDFLIYVMRECIVEQHKRTCFEKMTRYSQSIDGFYFEFFNNLYVKNEHEFQVDFQAIRIIQLMQVMHDLRMFEEG